MIGVFGVMYCCPTCVSTFALERSSDDPAVGVLTCPVCGCAAVRVDSREREMIEAGYALQRSIRDLIAVRAKETRAVDAGEIDAEGSWEA